MRAAEPAVPTHDPDEVRRAADEILARPEFLPEPRSLQERVFEWIADAFGRLIEDATGGGRGSIVAIAVIVVATAVAGWALYRLVRTMSRDRRVAVDVGDDDVGRSPRDWLAEAAVHEAKGDWRQAVRCRYRALVAELTDRGLLEEVPGRTSGEYRRLVASALPDGAPPFAAASDTFDRAWYGSNPAGPDDAIRVREAAEGVLRVAA